MGLARAWRRRLYASLGVAVVVPGALLVSLAMLAAGGGSFSLGSLRQAVSGPSAPTVQPVALGTTGSATPARSDSAHSVTVHRGPVRARLLGAVPAAHHRTSSTSSVTAPSDRVGQGSQGGSGHNGGGAGSGGGSGSGSGSGGGGGSGSGGGGSGGSGGGSGGGGGGTGGGGGGGGGTGGGGGGGSHPSHQTVVDRIVKAVTPVTSKLPSPVGPVVTKVVKTVGKVGDGVLSHLP
jgi:hypothetical protein